MQEQILHFFQSISTPLLDLIFEIFTMFGEDLLIIAVIAWIYWNYDKYKGFILSYSLITSLVINNTLKIIFRSPRPFQVLSQLEGKRVHTATGYSFPSGHTQGAATFYSSLVKLFKKKLLFIVSLIIILAVAISRIYLAVHWPIDVLVSLILGVITSMVFVPRLVSIQDEPDKKFKYIIILNFSTIIILLIAIACKTVLFKGNLKTDDLIKMTGLLNGVSLGFLLDMRRETFINKAKIVRKISRYILGLAGAFLLMEGLKTLFPYTGIFHYIRYGLTGLWITWLFPMLGAGFSLFNRSD